VSKGVLDTFEVLPGNFMTISFADCMFNTLPESVNGSETAMDQIVRLRVEAGTTV
jgi:hypothetical protein